MLALKQKYKFSSSKIVYSKKKSKIWAQALMLCWKSKKNPLYLSIVHLKVNSISRSFLRLENSLNSSPLKINKKIDIFNLFLNTKICCKAICLYFLCFRHKWKSVSRKLYWSQNKFYSKIITCRSVSYQFQKMILKCI